MSDPATLALAAVDSLGAAGAPSAAPGQPLIDFVSRLVGEARTGSSSSATPTTSASAPC